MSCLLSVATLLPYLGYYAGKVTNGLQEANCGISRPARYGELARLAVIQAELRDGLSRSELFNLSRVTVVAIGGQSTRSLTSLRLQLIAWKPELRV